MVNKRGRVFDTRVLGASTTGDLTVEPLDRCGPGAGPRRAT
jgi:hypothetical protein